MKKIVFALFVLMVPALVSAQDILTKMDGTDLQVKVMEISSSEIKYKRFNNPDGPTYSIQLKDVFSVTYENGEKETFSQSKKSVAPAVASQKYRDLKEVYSYENYVYQMGDRHSPGWCGFGSAVIAGLGQAINDEWGRAAGFFFGNLLLYSLSSYNLQMGAYYGDPYLSKAVLYSVLALGVDIWSIVDAVRVTKVKNLYYRDLTAHHFEMNCSPALLGLNYGTGSTKPVLGMQLSLAF